MHCIASPHPVWTTAGSSAFEVNKASILAMIISGTYRTDSLCRFWSDNRQGYCLAETCDQLVGDLEHLLLHCPALNEARQNLQQMWLEKAAVLPPLHVIVSQVITSSPARKMKFILDPSSMAEIIFLFQTFGKGVLDIVYYMARTYAYGLHRKRLILIGKWPYATKDENCNNVNQIKTLDVAGTMTKGPGVMEGPTTARYSQGDTQYSQTSLTSPVSTDTSGQGGFSNHAEPSHSRECPSVASMHHHVPVHAQQAHYMPVDSGRCADGDSELESNETSGLAVDNQSTLTTCSQRSLQQRQDNTPVVMVGCQGGAAEHRLQASCGQRSALSRSSICKQAHI